jgi:hypothetical protein
LEEGTQIGAGEDLKPPNVLHRIAVEQKGLKVSTCERDHIKLRILM